MTEICNDMLIEELWELKSKTCNTMKTKMEGSDDCKFALEIKNAETGEYFNMCQIDMMVNTIKQPDKRKIKCAF